MDQVTQQNAANSEQAAAAAEELNAQAVAMTGSVRDVAQLVGYQMEEQHGMPGAPVARKSAPKPVKIAPPKKKAAAKPAAIPAKSAPRGGNDEVFPLDEDDLKEF